MKGRCWRGGFRAALSFVDGTGLRDLYSHSTARLRGEFNTGDEDYRHVRRRPGRRQRLSDCRPKARRSENARQAVFRQGTGGGGRQCAFRLGLLRATEARAERFPAHLSKQRLPRRNVDTVFIKKPPSTSLRNCSRFPPAGIARRSLGSISAGADGLFPSPSCQRWGKCSQLGSG